MCYTDTPVHTETRHGFLIEVFQDDDAQNPITDYEMAGEFVRFDEFGRSIKEHCSDWENAHSRKEGFLYAVRDGQYKTGLLWLFQVGSRLTWSLFKKGDDIETETFNGFFYLSAETIRREWGTKWTTLSDGTKHSPYEMAKRYADANLKVVRDYYEGDVYGYVVSRLDDDEEKIDEVGSCWGFIGAQTSNGWYVLEEAQSIADHEHEQDKKADAFCAQFMQC